MEDRASLPDGARRRCLVPDLDGEFAVSEPLDELLCSLADWANEDPEAVPSAFHRPASDAIGEIRMAMNASQYHPLYAPDRRYEHEPLAIIELPAATIDAASQVAAELGRAVHGGSEIGLVVREFATAWGRRGTVTAERLVEVAARLHGVCDLGWGTDEHRIARCLDRAATNGDVGVRIVLDPIEEAAYGRIRDRLVRMWHDFDPLSRWLY
jgi:hypothetical protein